MKNGKTRANILVTRKLPERAEMAFAEAFECRFNGNDTPKTADQIITEAEGMDAIALTSMDKFGAKTIEALPNSVRVLATVSVGYEHIDLAAAKARGIVVTNTPEVLTDATADIAILLMLGAARGAYWGERMVRENRWSGFSIVHPLGHDVSDMRLGILGMGRIGVAVAKRAKAFGMSLYYHNRHPSAEADALGATYFSKFEGLLPHCDFLSINCPLTPETRGIINAQSLARLPKGAIVVNTSRGGVVNDDDLIRALQAGHLAAAGLDVFNNEPDLDPRYRELQNVFLLPHLGSATVRTRTEMSLRALSNLKTFFSGTTPKDRLT
jgi:lactate dehydrogenase-like 2-hydroxyacid dehydrogenase